MSSITLVPAPVSLTERGGDPFRLDAAAAVHAPGAAAEVGEYLAGLLRTRTGFALPVAGSDGGTDAAGIHLTIDPGSAAPDGYTLLSGAEGITITAASAAGLFHGVQTLRQLFPAEIEAPLDGADTGVAGVDWTVPAALISDAPRFAYRGAMLDVARNVFSVADVMRYIDAIALLKLNHLHLHLSDDQGWRLQIDSWPRLTEIGGSTSVLGGGGFFTKADYAEIVAYAAGRFVTIVPEIDLPGHTNAALASYAELNIGGVATSTYRGTEVGISTVDTTAEATWRFVDDVVRELAEMTPGPYLHLGGDESLTLSAEDFSRFVARASRVGAASGKTVIGWHEMGQSGELAPGTVGQYWDYLVPRADAAAHTLSFVEQGGSVILSPADVSYLDIHYPDSDRLGQDWADGPTSVEQAYSWDPSAIVPGLPEESVLGVEAAIWTETMRGMGDVEFMAFPRIVAVAEIAWSPAPAGTPTAAPDAAERSFAEFSPRLTAFAKRLDALGIRYHRTAELAWR
ncbi:MAG: family 20 glycosylhydrolase [Microterricola sp.]